MTELINLIYSEILKISFDFIKAIHQNHDILINNLKS
jgi:hypothetical protein